MPRKSKKSILLKILRQILNEYRENNHKARITDCALCTEYMVVINTYWDNCYGCPMVVFNPAQTDYPCLSRKCAPVDCQYGVEKNKDIELKRVIRFYEKIIERIESMSTEAVRKSSFKFMIKIDKEVLN